MEREIDYGNDRLDSSEECFINKKKVMMKNHIVLEKNQKHFITKSFSKYMEDSNKLNFKALNNFSSVDLRDGSKIEILNYWKN